MVRLYREELKKSRNMTKLLLKYSLLWDCLRKWRQSEWIAARWYSMNGTTLFSRCRLGMPAPPAKGWNWRASDKPICTGSPGTGPVKSSPAPGWCRWQSMVMACSVYRMIYSPHRRLRGPDLERLPGREDLFRIIIIIPILCIPYIISYFTIGYIFFYTTYLKIKYEG